MKTFGIHDTPMYDEDGHLTRAGFLLSMATCPIVFRTGTQSKTDEQRSQMAKWLQDWQTAGFPNPESFHP